MSREFEDLFNKTMSKVFTPHWPNAIQGKMRTAMRAIFLEAFVTGSETGTTGLSKAICDFDSETQRRWDERNA